VNAGAKVTMILLALRAERMNSRSAKLTLH